MRVTRHDGMKILEFSFDGDFNAEFIKALKAEIGPQYRSYNPDTKIWTIHKPAWPVFREIRKRHYVGENQEDLFRTLQPRKEIYEHRKTSAQ